MNTLIFNNKDAIPKITTIKLLCNGENIAKIMEWYGAYFSGDAYTVSVNGHNIPMDLNGHCRDFDNLSKATSVKDME